jgi:hypothetical protein
MECRYGFGCESIRTLIGSVVLRESVDCDGEDICFLEAFALYIHLNSPNSRHYL